MREHTINLGNYESLKIGASVETEADGIGPGLAEEMEKNLDNILANDIKEAVELLPAGSTSYIQSWRVDA
jgi:hypothetical protein